MSLWNLITENEPQHRTERIMFWDLFTSFDQAPDSDGSDPHEQAAPSAEFFNRNLLFWALRNLPASEAVKHFLVSGVSGSGKTIAIRLFLQSIRHRFRRGEQQAEQLIIFDAKCDAVAQLAAYGYKPEDENVWLLNPFDRRGTPWNIAEMVQNPAMARHFANLIIPQGQSSDNRFWEDAPREIIIAVITALNEAHGTLWTFRDLMCALDSKDHVVGVCASHPRAKRVINELTADEKHFPGIMTTLASHLGQFETVAALWHTAPDARQFSIEKFLNEPGILVLGYDPVYNECLWPLNAMLLRALTNEILRRPNTDNPRHWFVLDEFPAMKRADAVHDLLNRGRSKGVSVTLGFQSTEGLARIYGKEGTNDLLGQCASKTFLRQGDAESAKWAENFFGMLRTSKFTYGETWNSNGEHSRSRSREVKDSPLFLASTFADLPLPEKGAYCCISDMPCLGSTVVSQRPFDQVLRMLIPPADVPSVIRRDSRTEQTLQPWNEDEERWHGIQAEAKKGKTEEKQENPRLPKLKKKKP